MCQIEWQNEFDNKYLLMYVASLKNEPALNNYILFFRWLIVSKIIYLIVPSLEQESVETNISFLWMLLPNKFYQLLLTSSMNHCFFYIDFKENYFIASYGA